MSVGRLWRVAALSSVVLSGAVGCASGGGSFAADLDRLRSEVASLRSQNAALGERLGAVESASRAPASQAVDSQTAPAVGARPRLEVVRLTPSETEEPLLASEPTGPAAPAAPLAAPAPRVRYRSTSKGIVEEIVPLDDATTRTTSGTVVAQAKPGPNSSPANRPSAPPAGRSQ
jgi:outer membrane murein-binding lipoprotein Lpp